MNRLAKCPANYVPLTPLTFIKRASMVYSNRTSVIYAGVSFTWRQTYERCCRLAYSLRSLNVVKNDVVSIYIYISLFLCTYVVVDICLVLILILGFDCFNRYLC